jgi:catecholate siderophore receptor
MRTAKQAVGDNGMSIFNPVCRRSIQPRPAHRHLRHLESAATATAGSARWNAAGLVTTASSTVRSAQLARSAISPAPTATGARVRPGRQPASASYYASWSRRFQPSGDDARGRQQRGLAPEITRNAEVGAKAELWAAAPMRPCRCTAWSAPTSGDRSADQPHRPDRQAAFGRSGLTFAPTCKHGNLGRLCHHASVIESLAIDTTVNQPGKTAAQIPVLGKAPR